MTKNDLRNGLAEMHSKLAELEAQARKLQNQNLADIIASAKGKMKQLGDHPDLDRVGDDFDQHQVRQPTTMAEAIERMRAEGNADPEGAARMNWPALFSPHPTPAIPNGTPPGSDFPAQQTPAFPGYASAAATPGVSGKTVETGVGAVAQPPGFITPPLHTTGFVASGGIDPANPTTRSGENDEPKVFHPGDPQFTERANQDFRDPNNVDLNADGTLRTAPNTKGASDNRDA